MPSSNFQEKLEMGIAGEDIVYPYLKRTNSLVQDMRYQKHEKGAGPRLEGTEGSLVLPDFAVWNKNPSKGNFLVDVKVKKDLYTVNGIKCFTVDRKYENYLRCVQVMKMDHLAIIFVHEGRLHAYKDSDLTCTTYFNNIHGTGKVYCFEYNKNKVVY